MKKNQNLVPVFEYMERDLTNNNLLNCSYNRYLLFRKQNIFFTYQSEILLNPIERKFENKLQFLIDTSDDLSNRKSEIVELWVLLLKFIDDLSFNSLYENYLIALLSITAESKIKNAIIEKLDTKLNNKIYNKFIESIKIENEEYSTIYGLILWFRLRYSFLKETKSGIPKSESTFLKNFFIDNPTSFDKIKYSHFYLYLDFIDLYKMIYFSNNDYNLRHKTFYTFLCISRINLSKTNSYFDNYYSYLKDYYTVKYENKPILNCLFDYFSGYGEKPFKLLSLFLLVNIIFTVFFFCFGINIHGINNLSNLDKLISYFYFNNTSMLTVGYGDHYPISSISKTLVTILQLLGFIISSSTVALFLRKIFRF